MVLNPQARSWFPVPQKLPSPSEPFDGEKASLPLLPCQVSNASASPPQNPTTPPAVVPFYSPNQLQYASSPACPVAYPFYFYYLYPGFQLYYQPLHVANSGLLMVETENDVMMKKKLYDRSEELKGLLGVSKVYEPQKYAKKFVPPRLKRTYFEGFRGKKLWKPKISGGGAYAVKQFVPLASHQKEEFPFCNFTTVMIKNIPNKYRRNSFMEFLDKCCLENQLEYDFLYLPMDFKSGDNLGYAFVNCTSASAAKRMKEVLHGYKWGCCKNPHGVCTSKKISETTWARIQGKDELINHFARSNFTCDNSEYLPVEISPLRDGSNFVSSVTHTIGVLKGCGYTN